MPQHPRVVSQCTHGRGQVPGQLSLKKKLQSNSLGLSWCLPGPSCQKLQDQRWGWIPEPLELGQGLHHLHSLGSCHSVLAL